MNKCQGEESAMWMRLLWAVAAAVLMGLPLPGAGIAAPMAEVEIDAAAAEGEAEADAVDRAALLDKAAPAMVRVEYTLRFDNGQAPGGEYGGEGQYLIEQERPMELAGWLLAGDRVICPDPMVHPRFIEAVHVVKGDQRIEATPRAWAVSHRAVMLGLAQPVKNAQPMSFEGKAEDAAFVISHGRQQAQWAAVIGAMPKSPIRLEDSSTLIQTGGMDGLAVDKDGSAVGLVMAPRLATDGSWAGDPQQWAWLNSAQRDAGIARIAGDGRGPLVPATLRFRSPSQSQRSRFMYDDQGGETERFAVALVYQPDRVLILADLGKRTTARLERITLHPREGEAIEAEFVHSLKNYGALIARVKPAAEGGATTPETMLAAARLSRSSIIDELDRLAFTTDFQLQGPRAEVHHNHDRVSWLNVGWRRHVYPRMTGPDNVFVFNRAGELIAFPISRRQKVEMEQNWGRESAELTAAQDLAAVLATPAEHIDPTNVPLSEEDENRLAWLGVETQALGAELARAQGVSEVTQDGQTGALVTFVYEGSPAAKLGIQPGMVLLRLHSEDQPKPIEIVAEQDHLGGYSFPWAQFDQAPVQAFERLPSPWRPRDNALTRALTDLGVGKTVSLEYHAEDQVCRADLTIEWGPRHYDAARRHKDDQLGLTVRNLTYEARHYFRKTAKDPGIIISKVESGSPADTAGIKPYEQILTVNNQPVHTIEQFQAAIQGQRTLNIEVARMREQFVRRIDLGASAEGQAPDGGDASEGDDEAMMDE